MTNTPENAERSPALWDGPAELTIWESGAEMRIVTIHFTGGPACQLTIPSGAVPGLFKSLNVAPDSTTLINNDDGPVTLLNRAQITFVEVA